MQISVPHRGRMCPDGSTPSSPLHTQSYSGIRIVDPYVCVCHSIYFFFIADMSTSISDLSE